MIITDLRFDFPLLKSTSELSTEFQSFLCFSSFSPMRCSWLSNGWTYLGLCTRLWCCLSLLTIWSPEFDVKLESNIFLQKYFFLFSVWQFKNSPFIWVRKPQISFRHVDNFTLKHSTGVLFLDPYLNHW